GKMRYRKEVHDGEHPAIVEQELWDEVQERLRRQGPAKGSLVRHESLALLQGLLRCAPCGCAMTPTQSSKHNKHYRYYVCLKALKQGVCPARSVPAVALEKFVVAQLRGLAAKDGLSDFEAWETLTAEEQVRRLQGL